MALFARPSPLAQMRRSGSDAEDEPLRVVREASGRNNAYLYSARASAYTQILYAHGLQTFAYSLSQGRMLDLRPDYEDRATVIFNVILPIVESQVSLYLGRPPEMAAAALTQDDRDIEAAKYASDIMASAEEAHHLPEIREAAATWLSRTGNVFLYTGWDPTGGRMFQDPESGEIIYEGDPIFRADSMFAWTLDPQAKTVDDSMFAHHTMLAPLDWVYEHFPKVAEKLKGELTDPSFSVNDGMTFENALLNMSPTHGGMLGANGGVWDIPRGDRRVEIQTYYRRSSPRFKEGRLIMTIARGGDPFMTLMDGPNPYIDWATGKRTLPIAHIGMIPVPGRLLAESLSLHVMPMQRAINKHLGQLFDNVELVGNPMLAYEVGSVTESDMTNEPGALLPVTPGASPPGYINPPVIPPVFTDAVQLALQFTDILARPNGPSSGDNSNVTSGIQQAIVEETKRQAVAPIMRRWENGWQRAWRNYLSNWRTFAIIPRALSVPGDNNAWRQVYFSGELANAQFLVKVVEGSTLPVTRSGVFAEWVELMKAGAAPIQADPRLAKMFWRDIGRPEIARTYRDMDAHIDKAYRNLQKVRMGQIAMADPTVDDPDSHLAIYQNFKVSPEWENLMAENPNIGVLMNILIQSYEALRQAKLMQMMAQMAALSGGQSMGMGGGGDKPPSPQARTQGSAKGRKPGGTGGDGGVPRGTQGFGGQRMPNPTLPGA